MWVLRMSSFLLSHIYTKSKAKDKITRSLGKFDLNLFLEWRAVFHVKEVSSAQVSYSGRRRWDHYGYFRTCSRDGCANDSSGSEPGSSAACLLRPTAPSRGCSVTAGVCSSTYRCSNVSAADIYTAKYFCYSTATPCRHSFTAGCTSATGHQLL
eukprot:XP_001707841.1 Hypothetical protein GL50803_32128 [Giardia lamblia ATCC 50803]